MYVCMYAYIYVDVDMYVCMCICVCVCVFVCVCVYTCMCTFIRIQFLYCLRKIDIGSLYRIHRYKRYISTYM